MTPNRVAHTLEKRQDTINYSACNRDVDLGFGHNVEAHCCYSRRQDPDTMAHQSFWRRSLHKFSSSHWQLRVLGLYLWLFLLQALIEGVNRVQDLVWRHRREDFLKRRLLRTYQSCNAGVRRKCNEEFQDLDIVRYLLTKT